MRALVEQLPRPRLCFILLPVFRGKSGPTCEELQGMIQSLGKHTENCHFLTPLQTLWETIYISNCFSDYKLNANYKTA